MAENLVISNYFTLEGTESREKDSQSMVAGDSAGERSTTLQFYLFIYANDEREGRDFQASGTRNSTTPGTCKHLL